MATFFELSHQAQKLIEQSGTLIQKFGFETAAANIQEHLEELKKKELMVVVAGEARRGKSSLLNALLNEVEPLFPVDINVCTNVVTIVRYGKQEDIKVYIEDPQSESKNYVEQQISRSQIPDFVSEKGNPNNYKNVRTLVAAIPNDLLKEGVVFVDTPGVGSLNIEHSEVTYSFLPNADLLLFVSDADSGMTESELNFLKRGYKYCQTIVYPLTKKDLNPDYLTILEDNRTKISNTLGIPASEVQIISVSSVAKLHYLKTGNKTMYTNSNYAALENSVWNTIANRQSEVLIKPFLGSIKEEILKVIDSVVGQYQIINSEQCTAEEMVKELDKKVEDLQDLQDKGADWRNELQVLFNTLNSEIVQEQQQINSDATDLLDNRVIELDIKLCEEDQYTKVICEVNDLISQKVIDIREMISDQIEDKSYELKNQMDFNVNVNEDLLKKMKFTSSSEKIINFPVRKVSDKVLKKGRNIAMNTVGGSAVGGILGGIVGLFFGGPAGVILGFQIGSQAGGAIGGAKGCVDSLRKYDEVDLNTVHKAIRKHISFSVSSVSNTLRTVLNELKLLVVASFEQQLKNTNKELQENITQIKENIKLTKNEIPKKLSVLQKQDELLKKQLSLFDSMETNLEAIERKPIQEKVIKNSVPKKEVIKDKPTKEKIVKSTVPKEEAEEAGENKPTKKRVLKSTLPKKEKEDSSQVPDKNTEISYDFL